MLRCDGTLNLSEELDVDGMLRYGNYVTLRAQCESALQL